MNSLTKQKMFFCSVDPRIILIKADFNEGGGRRELLSTNNFVSFWLCDQPLAETKHS